MRKCRVSESLSDSGAVGQSAQHACQCRKIRHALIVLVQPPTGGSPEEASGKLNKAGCIAESVFQALTMRNSVAVWRQLTLQICVRTTNIQLEVESSICALSPSELHERWHPEWAHTLGAQWMTFICNDNKRVDPTFASSDQTWTLSAFRIALGG